MPLDGLQLGHYRLLRLIGSGGMGEVYLAEDPRIQRQVAIKVVRTEVIPYPSASTSMDAARLFQREARAIAMLDHPHILPLYDYGEEIVNGTSFAYLVMPYRPEGSLANWLRERSSSGLLSMQDVAHIVQQAAEALQYAHNHLIVHQDVKPSNFLLRSNSSDRSFPDLLLTDFGVAKLTTATSSVSHNIRGTPMYMAPEQWEGNPVPATDQYSLAVMVYELMTGQPPFQGSPMRMMYLHASAQPQPPSALNPQISTDIDTVLLRALAKKPTERFASVSEFANAVRFTLPTTDSPTIIKTPLVETPRTPSSNELRATLAISESEARTGSSRTLTLPGGRQVKINVPAGVHDGQVIHLDSQDISAGDGSLANTLVLTIAVLPTREMPAVSPTISGETFIQGSSRLGGANTEVATSSSQHPAVLPVAPVSFPGSQETGKKRFFSGKTALLLGLVVLILLASGGLLFTTLSNQVAIRTAAATAQANNAANAAANNATAQSNVSTVQANNAAATAQANAIATTQANNAIATAQARLAATAQANANATATVQTNPSSSTVLNPYPPYTGALALNDPMRDNSQGNNWTDYANNVSECTFSGGAYHVLETKSPYYADCFAGPIFSNFAYEIHMQIIQGDCGGIIFRADARKTQFYFFRVCQDGSYALLSYVDNTNANAQTLASGSSPAINTGTGQTNVVAVVAQGSQLNLYVNQQSLGNVNDGSYSSGQIAVFAQSQGNTTEDAFSNARVWTL